MIDWRIKHGDILDEPADVLICSANVFLNLSGGVGGEILLRYGDEMQKALHRSLAERNLRFVRQGDVVQMSACGTPFKAVLHAVAVDGFYQSSPAVITELVSRSLTMAADLGARKVALTALATGFGRLSMQQFGEGIVPLVGMDFPRIQEIVICLRTEVDCTGLRLTMGMKGV